MNRNLKTSNDVLESAKKKRERKLKYDNFRKLIEMFTANHFRFDYSFGVHNYLCKKLKRRRQIIICFLSPLYPYDFIGSFQNVNVYDWMLLLQFSFFASSSFFFHSYFYFLFTFRCASCDSHVF